MWLLALACAPSAPVEPPAPPPSVVVAPAPPVVVAPAPPVDPEVAALDRAEAMANEARARLSTRMIGELNQKGPSGALETCSIEADALTTPPTPDPGARVGRASLRLRNPANAPPAWVSAWLADQGSRTGAEAVGFRRVDDTADGRLARVLQPIVVQPPCLTCHGDPSTFDADLVRRLAERYPNDLATGYAVGDLRGAMWAEVAVAR